MFEPSALLLRKAFDSSNLAGGSPRAEDLSPVKVRIR